jgi:hypothetical protein
MISNILPFPARPSAPPEFTPGDIVRLDDGRDGFIRRRQFRHDSKEVEFYDITLSQGRGSVWVRPQRVQPFFPVREVTQ